MATSLSGVRRAAAAALINKPVLKYAAAFHQQQLGIGVLEQATTSSNAEARVSVGELARNGDV